MVTSEPAEDQLDQLASLQLTQVGADGASSKSKLATNEKPFFFPPLWLGRRTAIVEILRKQGIRTVADLGCGPGALLQILSMPANSLDDFPANLYPPSPYSASPADDSILPSSRTRKLDTLRKIPRAPGTEAELHLRRLVGVDINESSLRHAESITAATEKAPDSDDHDSSPWARTERERWEELRIELFLGGLEVYNEALDSMDAMVATEVIEHLSDQALLKFGSVVLGVYQARTVVVTTPNHEFNPYFVSTSKEEEEANRYPDPTGRTTRVFRDSDHKFEWTQAEFQKWASDVAVENEYSVQFSGVGSLCHYFGSRPIPFPPPSLDAHPALVDSPASLAVPKDPSQFFATQIATFTRQYPNESQRSPRSHRTTPLPFFSPVSTALATLQPEPPSPGAPTVPIPPRLVHRKSTAPAPHVLLKSTTLRAVPSAGNPSSPQIILKEIESLYDDYFERPKVCLRDLWNQSSVRIACGGVIANLVDAIVDSESDNWEIEIIAERKGDAATDIVWKGWKEKVEGTRAAEDDEDEDELSDDDGEPYVAYVGDELHSSADWDDSGTPE